MEVFPRFDDCPSSGRIGRSTAKDNISDSMILCGGLDLHVRRMSKCLFHSRPMALAQLPTSRFNCAASALVIQFRAAVSYMARLGFLDILGSGY